jgi:hypothetical protein
MQETDKQPIQTISYFLLFRLSFLRTKFLCINDAESMIIPVITPAMTISPMIILLVNGNKKNMVTKIAATTAITITIIIGANEPLIIARNKRINIFILYR